MSETLTWKDRDPLTSLDRRLPPGFLAVDLARSLNLPLFHPNTNNSPVPADAPIA